MKPWFLGVISCMLVACSSPLRREEIAPEERAKAFELAQLALVGLEKGELGQARMLARDALDRDPFCYEALVANGRVALTQEKVGEAESQFRMALELEPKRVEAYVGLGEAALKINRFESASTHFAEAARLDPHNPAALRGQARACTELGRDQEVLDILHEYLEINPTDVDANLMMGKALLKRKPARVSEAEFYLTQAAKQEPKNIDVLNALGVVRLRCKRFDDAAGLFEAALTLDPNRADLHCNLGIVQEQGFNASAMAESQYRRALAIDAVHAPSVLRLADLLAGTGRRDEAVQLLEGAERDPRTNRADKESFREKRRSLPAP
ncbi:MAG: tetratricopeptide repeat protein [Planctomycetota bacterium]